MTNEVVPEVIIQFDTLLAHVGKVDEKAAAHVALERLDLVGVGRSVLFDEQVAVFEQTAAADLFRVPRGDHLAVEVSVRLCEVAVHRLAHHRRVEVLAQRDVRRRSAVVEEQQRVQDDLRSFLLFYYSLHFSFS